MVTTVKQCLQLNFNTTWIHHLTKTKLSILRDRYHTNRKPFTNWLISCETYA